MRRTSVDTGGRAIPETEPFVQGACLECPYWAGKPGQEMLLTCGGDAPCNGGQGQDLDELDDLESLKWILN